MKIAIINQPQDPMVAGEEQRGSVAIVNWELARQLARRHEVVIYAPLAAGQAPVEYWDSLEIRRVRYATRGFHKGMQLLAGRFRHGLPYFTSLRYFREYFTRVASDLHRHPADIVHLPQQMQFAPLFRHAVPGSRFVVHMHQDELAQLDYEHLRGQLTNLDAVVTVSDYVTSRARERFPEFASRIHTIGNGVDVRRFHPDPDRSSGVLPRELLFVGRIAPDKGVHLLMEAFDVLAREIPDLQLHLVGKPGMLPFDLLSLLLTEDVALQSLQEFYGRSALEWFTKEVLGQRHSYLAALRARLSAEAASRVHFLGSIPLAQLIQRYQETDLLVLPSVWQESYGLPVAEAMASGVPVLASRCGGVPELVEDGVTGRLVPRCDRDALVAALREMLSDPRRLREMGAAARSRAERLLTWRRSAERLEAVYSALLASSVARVSLSSA